MEVKKSQVEQEVFHIRLTQNEKQANHKQQIIYDTE